MVQMIQMGGETRGNSNRNNTDLIKSDTLLKHIQLFNRERDVLTLIAKGHDNKKIAEKLYLSKYTIATPRKKIMQKL